jgi:uncharacterized integral membrane protein
MIFLILSLLIIALVVVFAVQNTALTTVNFFVWTFQGSLALILLIALSAGVLISLLASLPTMVNNRLTLRSHKKKLVELEANLSDHKGKLEEAERKLQEQEKGKQEGLNPPQKPA